MQEEIEREIERASRHEQGTVRCERTKIPRRMIHTRTTKSSEAIIHKFDSSIRREKKKKNRVNTV